MRSTLVLSIILGASFTVAVSSGLGQAKPERIQEIDYLAPPETFSELAAKVDTIARIRVRSTAGLSTATREPRILLRHTAVVADVIKSGVGIKTGQVVAIVQPGGSRDEGVRITRVDESQFPRLAESRDYLLFMNWNPTVNVFEISFGPHGTYALSAGRVDSPSHAKIAESVKTESPDRFLAALRAVVARPM